MMRKDAGWRCFEKKQGAKKYAEEMSAGFHSPKILQADKAGVIQKQKSKGNRNSQAVKPAGKRRKAV